MWCRIIEGGIIGSLKVNDSWPSALTSFLLVIVAGEGCQQQRGTTGCRGQALVLQGGCPSWTYPGDGRGGCTHLSWRQRNIQVSLSRKTAGIMFQKIKNKVQYYNCKLYFTCSRTELLCKGKKWYDDNAHLNILHWPQFLILQQKLWTEHEIEKKGFFNKYI